MNKRFFFFSSVTLIITLFIVISTGIQTDARKSQAQHNREISQKIFRAKNNLKDARKALSGMTLPSDQAKLIDQARDHVRRAMVKVIKVNNMRREKADSKRRRK